LSDNSQ